MGLFRKKKRPKYVDELWGGDAPSSLEQKKTGDEDASGSQQDQQKNPAMEYCEQILTAAKALEETKRDYKTVTDYLTDIQKIEDLPEKEFSEVEEEWRYYKDALEQESRVLRKLLLVLAGVFVAAAVLIAILGMALHFDITLPFLAATLVAAVIGIAMVWRLQNDGVDIKRSQANINRAITLLNKISFKYVNVTNAVDYACEKYHAKNSYELNYIWEQYMEELRERDKYQKTNDELEYFNDKLVMLLQQYRLYDAKVWIYQAQALLDKKEMVEVKHELIVRRQKLRATLESQIANIRKAQADIVKIVKERPGDEKEIKNILKSVDEICGLA